MGKRSFIKNIKRGFGYNFWGKRCYVTVRVPSSEIPILFPDGVATCPDLYWGQRGYKSLGWEGSFAKINADGTYETVEVGEVNGGDAPEGIDPLLVTPSENEDLPKWDSWWEGKHIHYIEDFMKTDKDIKTLVLSEDALPSEVILMHRDWDKWLWKNIYGSWSNPAKGPQFWLQCLANVGKSCSFSFEKSGGLVMVIGLKDYSTVRCASILEKFKKVCKAKITI